MELKEKLSRMYEVKDPNAIFVFKFQTHFGEGKSTGFGLIYDSVENAKKYKPKYRLIRIHLFRIFFSINHAIQRRKKNLKAK
ncbi:40S ribosomal protein S24-2 [Camellia lanceoleosa]|uniref:40S ribosomal protein S24-2 n=1 Tax=Camellia lanceoleosa TaxID=1840588 RepID=A0ACC0G4U3_9ERIC|nr:40S ribosomal protein S24-2 [Camellia lanceoleosa]